MNYRLWAVGALISNIGTWMQRTAQDWLVLTQLTQHNATAVGIVMACQFGPQLLFLPWSGFAADYFDRRKLLMVTQSVMGVLSLILGVLTVTGWVTLWQVYLLAFLFGCAAAFDAPVRQTFVGDLVGDSDLANAVALNSTSFNSARMIGPALTGILIAAIGTGWAFLLNSASFLAVLLSLSLMRPERFFTMTRAKRAKGSFSAGFRYVYQRRDLCAILSMAFVIGTFGLNFPIYISTMAVTVFHSDAQGYGFLSSCMAIGTVSGAIFSASQERPRMRTLMIGAALFGVGCTFGALAPSYRWFAVILVLIGMAALIFNNTNNSLIQLSTESSVRGRVMAIRMAILMGGTPIGAPIAGWVIDHAGPRWGLMIGAASGFIATLIALRYVVTTRRLAAQSAAEQSL
ncbi:MFS transporter [Celerinatantimonas yamalensis]|uniref:MFS transporter n=1 Tax=Celerinatantimonas yamalensis TaxID=559956 RepID=A0ABW9G8W5_9GAMM